MKQPVRISAIDMNEGDGARVKRLMPVAGMMNHDPFVLFDHFTISGDAGFPDHPHRGFEAITYLFAGGSIHRDNLGNHSTVMTGGAQRFTAGAGLVHSEMPAVEGDNSGIQLWINLPKRLKGCSPDYQQVDADAFPEHPFADGRVRVIVGEGSPLKLQTPVRYLDITLEAGSRYEESFPEPFNGLLYLVEGRMESGGVEASQGEALCYESVGSVAMLAEERSRVMLAFGHPHHEPILQRGPFVD